MSFYDTNLLIIKDRDINFKIIGFQTNNTFNVRTKAFINKEKKKIIEAKFKAKSQIMLETGTSQNFNGYYMTIEDKTIIIIQKNKADKLIIVDIEDNVNKQQYMEQHTCGTYILLIRQTEAIFDYSITVQSKETSNDNIVFINKQIQW